MDTDKKNTTLREGFLVKRGHLVHNWKARWFVLMPDKLLYYKYEGGKRDSCQRGKILLKDCVTTCPFLEYENRPLVLKLQTKNGADHFLEACSRQERDDWAGDITAAVDKLQAPEGVKVTKQQDPAGTHLHNINLSKVLDSMYDVHSGINMSNHVEQGNTYSNCFSGSEGGEPGEPVGESAQRLSVHQDAKLLVLTNYLHLTDDISPAGGFSLRSCLVSSLHDNGVPSGVKGNIQGNLFKIITQSDTHYFMQAPTHQQKMDWVDAIRKLT
ncbi:pleckstrin-2 [Lycodopsis pacificus]